MAQPLTCPWCGHEEATEEAIHYHIEERHTEDSPFVVKGSDVQHSHTDVEQNLPFSATSSSDSTPRLKCTRPGCGIYIELKDIDEHLRHHDAAGDLYDSPQSSRRPKASSSTNERTRGKSTAGSLISFFSRRSSNISSLQGGSKKARLGREELGYYAFEKAMPSSVRKALETAERPVTQQRITSAGKLIKITSFPNETSGLIEVLAGICELSESTHSYLCHVSTKHVHRVKCDGNFCGYWNIQMLVSYILAISDPDRGLPTVLQIQETIEAAWDAGICTYAKVETGGIRNTRKWIGTHEALAFFTSLGLTPTAASFKPDNEAGKSAHDELLDFVEAYFTVDGEPAACTITDRPPIYLQRAGHSITIVGIQRRKSGKRNLIVFDPSHDTQPAMSRLLNGASIKSESRELLEPYLRSERRLAAWQEYEVLTIESCEGLKLP